MPGSCFGSFPLRAPSRLELIPPRFPASESPGAQVPSASPAFHPTERPSRVNGPLPGRYLTVSPPEERSVHPPTVVTETPGGIQSRFTTTAVIESVKDREGEYSSRTSVGESILILALPETNPPGILLKESCAFVIGEKRRRRSNPDAAMILTLCPASSDPAIEEVEQAGGCDGEKPPS